MKLARKDRFRIAEQAALQLIRSTERDSEEARKELLEWSMLSVHHVHELLLAQAVAKQFEKMDPDKIIDLRALPTLPEWTHDRADDELFAQTAPPDAAPGTDLKPSAQNRAVARTPRLRRWQWPLALAATCAVLAVAWLIASLGLGYAPSTYSTAMGEQRSIKLGDGSVMVLNTESRAQVRFSDTLREIRLLEGEALFLVQHDPARPFEVATDAGTLRALGTQFNVYRRQGETRVAVLEGAVQVVSAAPEEKSSGATIRLVAGDEATVGRGQIVKSKKPDIARSVAWRARQLIFRDSTLAQVAEEFNRYNKTRIHIEGGALRARSLSGVFDADDVEPLIKFLQKDSRLKVQRSGDEVWVRMRMEGEGVDGRSGFAP